MSIKVISINILIFFFIVVFFETISYLLRKNLEMHNLGWIYSKNGLIVDQIANSCTRMRHHPSLTYIRDHAENCNLKGAKLFGPFVYYNDNNFITNKFEKKNSKSYILTLGGSTTDGAFQHFSNGNTWPYLLNKIFVEKQLAYSVINGGVGGYGSHQELIKLLTVGGNLNKKISHIISLNGINDIDGYRGLDQKYAEVLPFWTKTQLDSYRYQKFIRQDGSRYYAKIFPNIRWALDEFILFMNSGYSGIEKSKDDNWNVYSGRYTFETTPRWKTALFFEDAKKKSSAKQWLYNVKMMNAISNQLGAKYYVFLQPTMGFTENQIPQNKNTNDYKVWKKFSDDAVYFSKLKKNYKQLRKFCNELSFCYDISEIAPPIGNFYSDIRHHNENGNKIIAENIFRHLDINIQ